MNTSQSTTKISTAIAAVQAAVESVEKNKKVEVEGRANWSAGYATLSVLHDAIREHVKLHRIAILQTVVAVQQLGPCLRTRVALEDEWIEVEYPIKTSRDGAQGFGGGITFARRWTLCGIFGLVPDDAEEGQGYKDAARANKAPRKAAAPSGLGALLEAIRDSDTLKTFEAAARAARSAHPSGEAAVSIDRAIDSRFVVAIDSADTGDKLVTCRDAFNRIQPRGAAVREAFARAEQRLGVGR